MSTKLTLNIKDKELILKAKIFAASQGKSLTVLVENLLRSMVEKPTEHKDKIPTKSKKLLGVLAVKPENTNEEDLKWEYLKEKYDL